MSKLIWFVAFASAAASAALGASRQNLPSAEFWAARSAWIVVALAVTFGVPLVQAAIVEMGERNRRKGIEREQKVQAFLITSLIYVAEQAGAPIKNTGIQAFVVRGRWWWKRQDRIGKIRLGAIPTSGVKWSKGKGVIGRCWSTRQPQYEDLEAHFRPYEGYSEARWLQLDENTTFGLTYQDFTVLRGKYGIVAAVPIVKNDKYIGCVTADMPPLGQGVQAPNREQILESLATTAALVAYVLTD